MRYSSAVCAAYVVSVAYGHGLVTSIQGANGVNMAGLSVIDGTPRNCGNPLCGSEADTSIIRKNELGNGRASALGRTNGGGPVDAAKAIQNFMGGAAGGQQIQGGQQQQGGQQRQQGGQQQQQQQGGQQQQKQGGGVLGGLLGNIKRGILDNLLGGKAGGGAQKAQALPKNDAPATSMAGMGAVQGGGMPTCDDNGVVRMTYRQVNQDGAGPLTAMIDSTSGGTDPNAFAPAQMVEDVPGLVAGLSTVSKTDFAISAQMPQGTVCKGQVGGMSNICVMRLNNNALAGPFGGSVAFTQSAGNRKRAIEYNLRKRELEEKLSKRHFARGFSFEH